MINHISSFIRLFPFTNDGAWFSLFQHSSHICWILKTLMFLQSNILLKEVVTFYLMICIYKNYILFYKSLANIEYVCDIFLWGHQRTEEGTGALGMGITDGCDSPDFSETAAVFFLTTKIRFLLLVCFNFLIHGRKYHISLL